MGKRSVWISWCDSPPERYDFDTEAEVNAFLKGIDEVASQTHLDAIQFEQFDSIEEFHDKYPKASKSCRRCGSAMKQNGHCRDETCPYSDREQDAMFTEG